ncbi:YkgJ family cysteine cluster protein [Maribacter sp. PR1]|uniref:YkgJ family cysteine cluster protein n=1 Tax=Maribacter cobaltidurans TaxID=1178778 RepID=A0ABU7IR57_9FLAO|nr:MULTISPECIES: YkgJ family cysteine cluster protein [Maribacter]MDC6388052.1 YkgJ family cysteine cluster protein [Maribacter sp. PR1]MEE1975440.1 YkgJ family cysteine cluster protein [Maribacter cobaltidurans]
MTLPDKVTLIEQLFHQLEKETSAFQNNTGLSCLSGCGRCCTYPDIEASPLEFLPWAFHLFLNGGAERMLQSLREIKTATCANYRPLTVVDQGHCNTYKYRGLICRLFGYAANTDKYGKLRLATCKIIKEGQAENFASASGKISQGISVPVFTEYYMQLNQIDFHLGNIIVPVNKALRMALEEVLQYYAYRPLPLSDKECV